MRAVLRALPTRQRTAIVLRFYEDLAEAQTAELMRCRPGTVKSLVSRGMDKLRPVMAGDYVDDRIRELLRDGAEDLPAMSDLPARTRTQVRRRTAFTLVATTLAGAALVVRTVVGLRQLSAAPRPVPATPPGVPITHHNGEIVFEGERSIVNGVLYALDPATGSRHQLLDCPPQTDGPKCNDGTALAFTLGDLRNVRTKRQDAVACHLYVMNADGSGVRSLSDGVVGRAAWQPLP